MQERLYVAILQALGTKSRSRIGWSIKMHGDASVGTPEFIEDISLPSAPSLTIVARVPDEFLANVNKDSNDPNYPKEHVDLQKFGVKSQNVLGGVERLYSEHRKARPQLIPFYCYEQSHAPLTNPPPIPTDFDWSLKEGCYFKMPS